MASNLDDMQSLVDSMASMASLSDNEEENLLVTTLTGVSGRKWQQSGFLDSGGMAKVYDVIPHDEDEHKYVVKVGTNLTDEIRLYTKIYSDPTVEIPQLPRYVDSGVTKSGAHFLIMPKYKPLFDRDYFKHMSDSLFLKIVEDVIVGLEYLHSAGFCHNDIKPDNVLYDPITDHFILVDFSVTSRRQSTPDTSYTLKRFAGTKIYTGLDTHTDNMGPSPRSDIDSLVFTMVCWAGPKLSWHKVKVLGLLYSEKFRFMETPAKYLAKCESPFKRKLITDIIELNKTTPFSALPAYALMRDVFQSARASIQHTCEKCGTLVEIKDALMLGLDDKKNKAAIAALKYMELW